nr:MBL fold metallo-hydrolase [Chitinophagaceae bacterium]
MQISFHGAARTVTGSKHIIHLKNGKKILLDCGLFQGMGDKTFEYNADLGFDATEINYVILSHAHIDHSGLLPKLIKDGYQGKIICTPATADLAEVLLLDSAFIQEADIAFVNKKRAAQKLPFLKPIYTIEDAKRVLLQLEAHDYRKKIKLDDDITVEFFDAGHILGSAVVFINIKENGKNNRIVFSGDVGRYRDIILKSPEEIPQADYIILESTYGDSLHDNFKDAKDELLKNILHTCIEKKGRLIIPSFSVGRTQEILYDLNKLEVENRLPKLNYYVDSPMSTKATQVVKSHPECYNQRVQDLMKNDKDPFDFTGLKFITEAQDSKALNDRKEPM